MYQKKTNERHPSRFKCDTFQDYKCGRIKKRPLGNSFVTDDKALVLAYEQGLSTNQAQVAISLWLSQNFQLRLPLAPQMHPLTPEP